ncbi:MAG: hypothetical protein AAF598_22315 [Bacteroidota bacterium]
MKKIVILTVFVCLTVASVFAQGIRIAHEFQVYPTGFIPGLRISYDFGGQHAIHTRLGYNVVRHRDLGVHENERGGGIGFSLGYDRYFGQDYTGFFVGARMDLWFNEVDWKDFIDQPTEVNGTTNVTVWQPTIEGGYIFRVINDHFYLAPHLALGLEVNVVTDGEEVGQGLIGLLGFQFGYRFH